VDHLHEGTVLGGRFRLVELAGIGGMGAVWRAVDQFLDCEVAVKELATATVAGSEARARFRHEARAASRLSHPAIAIVHDFGEAGLPGGATAPYIVMEYLCGQTLKERLRRGPLPPDEALRVMAPVADALDCAHRAGVVHRDIKPANIMLTPAGVKVLDFGTAALRGRPMSEPLHGPLSYLAPELARYADAGPAADVYALGVVFMACLTGAATQAVAAPASLPPASYELPAGLAELWGSCLGVSPQERPSAGDIAAVSRQALRGFRAPQPVATAGRHARRRPRPAGRTAAAGRRRLLAGSGAVAAVAAGVFAIMFTQHPASPSPVAPDAASTSPTATTPAKSATPPTPATPGTPAPDAAGGSRLSPGTVIGMLSLAIQQGVASGQIRSDAGVDLTNLIQPVAADLNAGRVTDVRQLAGALRAKIATREREGAVTPREAGVLDDLIGRLQTSASGS
jgi:eukaryotic-like serine/threonine-protein kinase